MTEKPQKTLLSKIYSFVPFVIMCALILFAGKEHNELSGEVQDLRAALAKKPIGPEGSNGNYVLPFDQYSYTMRLGWPSNGDGTKDSLLVIDELGRWVRRIKPVSAWLAPYALTSALSAYTPTSRTITINGTALDLSANRSWTIPGTTYTAGTGLSLTGTAFANTAPDQTVALTAGNRISVSGTYPNFTVAYIEPTATIVTRTLNSNYTISTTKQALSVYYITATATNPLLAGTSAGTAYLEYSLNGGTTWINPGLVGNSNGVGIAVAVALTNGQTSALVGTIPANALVRIRTVLTGTSTATYAGGQETY